MSDRGVMISFSGFVAEIEYLLDVLGLVTIQGAFPQRLPGQNSNHVFGDDIAAGALLADDEGDDSVRYMRTTQRSGLISAQRCRWVCSRMPAKATL